MAQLDMLIGRLAWQRRTTSSASISTHGAFVAILTVWGAALLGLSVAVLSPAAIARMAAVTGTGSLQAAAQPVFSLLAAAIGAAIAGPAALALHRRSTAQIAQNTIIPGLKGHFDEFAISAAPVEPIDPKSELGSDSLDEPVTTMPFAAQTEDDPEPVDEIVAKADILDAAPFSGAYRQAPRAMSLTDFGQMSERDGVWVIEPAAVHDGDNDADGDTIPPAEDEQAGHAGLDKPVGPTRALAQLRAARTDDLSLLQMVERFAAALHAHHDGASGPQRDEALAQSLRALELFDRNGFDCASHNERIAASDVAGLDEPDTAGMLHDVRGAA
ncbi:MAG: hypothetical protein WA936_01725 [Erythrobacter sp.]